MTVVFANGTKRVENEAAGDRLSGMERMRGNDGNVARKQALSLSVDGELKFALKHVYDLFV